MLPCPASGVAVVSGIGAGAALDGMPSGVAQVVYRRLVYLLYCVRWNRANQRKSRCKRLCVADTLPGKKKSPAPSADARQKKSPASGAGWIGAHELNFVLVKKCFHFVIIVFCQLVIPLVIRYMIDGGWKIFFLVACKIEFLIAF